MCGRFTITTSASELVKRFKIIGGAEAFEPRYNLAPSQLAPLVLQEEQGRMLRMIRWGLIPHWAKDHKIGYKMINARSETLSEKPSFRPLLAQHRALVLADGFYEWKEGAGNHKVPFRICRKDRAPFAMAGLWTSWTAPSGDKVLTFTIVTGPANGAGRQIHERMPIILSPEGEAAWLDPTLKDQKAVLGLLLPYPPDSMEAYETTSKVNSARFEDPACIEAVS